MSEQEERLDSRFSPYVDWTNEELEKLLTHIDDEAGRLRAELAPWLKKMHVLDEVVQEWCNVKNLLNLRKQKED